MRATTAPLAGRGLYLCTLTLLLGACRASQQPHTEDPRAARELAQTATRTGNWTVAADCWYAVFLSDEDRPLEPCLNTVRAMTELKDYKGANRVLDLGLQRHPENPDLLEAKGKTLTQLGFRRPAEDYLLRALAIEPERVSALIALGELRLDLGLESSAIEPLQRAIRISGGDFRSYNMLARAARAAGDPVLAYQAYAKAFSLGDGELEDLVAASALYNDPLVRKACADAAASAKRWLERAIERDPQCTQAHFQLGVLSEALDLPAQAIAHYRRAVETDPACLEALTNLAVLYAELNDEANTRAMVQRALVLEKDDNRRKALEKLEQQFDGKRLSVDKRVP